MTDTHTTGARDAHADSDAARDAQESAPARDARGRFQPGQSGNPAGKKPGTRNRATQWAERLADGEFDSVADQVVALAQEGDFRAIRFLLERADPKPRGRPIELDFTPEMSVLERFLIVSQAMADGEITPEEARTVALFLDLEGRERARMIAAEEMVFRNRKTRNAKEFRGVIRHLDKVFPQHLTDEEQEPGLVEDGWLPGEAFETSPAVEAAAAARAAAALHPTCNSEPAASSAAPASASAAGSGSASPLGEGCRAEAQRAEVGLHGDDRAAAALHSACNSSDRLADNDPAAHLPTKRRRAVNRVRAMAR